MDESKILIIGKNGQLGTALALRFPDAQAVNQDDLDISDTDAVAAFDWSNIETIINAAAYTNVDGAETEEGRRVAWQANAAGPANLSRIAAQNDIALVHISSEYVFDGTIDNHTEKEALSPLSAYGASKAAGDIAVALNPKHYIVRTSWVIGDGNNFVRTMMGLADRNISPTVVNDQIGRLTFTTELVKAISHLLNTSAEYGIYNVTNGGEPVSWADITRTVFKELDRDDLSVTNTSTADYFANKPESAHRPLLSTMDLKKIHETGFKTTDWRDSLSRYISTYE